MQYTDGVIEVIAERLGASVGLRERFQRPVAIVIFALATQAPPLKKNRAKQLTNNACGQKSVRREFDLKADQLIRKHGAIPL